MVESLAQTEGNKSLTVEEEVDNGEPVAQKHAQLAKEENEGVELMENKYTQNVTNPFINHQRSWDEEEHFKIPADVQKGIVEECEFQRPSNI